jgi:transposase
LTAKELARLRRTIIGKNPDQLNFGTLLWTLPIVRELIKRMFGKELYSGTVGRYLNRLGLTPQKPIRRAYQRDEAEIRRWVTHEFPRISSDVQRKQAVLLFLDETGVHENAPVGTTWGKRGTRPIVRVTGNRSKINVISAVAPSGRLWFRCYRGNLNTDRFTEFLAALLHDVRGDIVLVMDSHPAHVSAKARTFMETRSNRLQVEFLPLYAPEINPDEHVWAVLKSLFRRNPLSQGERLDSAVESAMREIRRRPSFVRALFGHPDLAYLDGKVA